MVIAKKIERQQELIDDLQLRINSLGQVLDSIALSNESYLKYIASFARHDLGNAVQNIAAAVRSIESVVSPEDAESIQAALNQLNATLENFGELIHSDAKEAFTIQKLMTALKTFVRSSLAIDNIQFETIYDIEDNHLISQPFQTLLQLLHNFVINSKKAIRARDKALDTPKRIVVEANICGSDCVIKVKDTGCGIPDSNIDRIFDFGFSTTDGSGIGLFHARHVCDEIGGEITVACNSDGFSTLFTIKFPTDGDTKDSGD